MPSFEQEEDRTRAFFGSIRVPTLDTLDAQPGFTTASNTQPGIRTMCNELKVLTERMRNDQSLSRPASPEIRRVWQDFLAACKDMATMIEAPDGDAEPVTPLSLWERLRNEGGIL